MVGVSSRTSCRQLFKELNILTLVSLYIIEVTCCIRKHHQFVEQNQIFILIIHAERWISTSNHTKLIYIREV